MEKQQARRCITRRNLFRLGAVVAGLGFMDAVGGVVPALAGNIGDTVWVTGDREIGAQTPYSGSFTYHTDGSSGDPVFCLEQNILNGTGNAYIVNLVGQRTGMYNHDGGGRVYMTWTQANVTDAALIQDWCYNASGYSGDDAYVACQGFIWSFCRCCGDYNAMATQMSYVPAKYQGRLAELISYIVKSRSVVDGVGLCYSKSNGDQWLARFYLSSPTTDVPVEKVWTGTGNEHYRPDSVTLHVQQTNGGGNRYDCTLNAANGWKGVFPGVVLNAGRTPTGWETTDFTVTEDAVKQFSPSVTGDVHSGFKVTNTLITPTGGLTVTKAWSGAGYQSYMPDQVTVHVRGSDGSDRQLTLTALSGWTASLDDLPVIADDGSLITYTVEEDPVEHFTPHVTGDAESGFTVTNEFVTPVSDVEVVKVWQGERKCICPV